MRRVALVTSLLALLSAPCALEAQVPGRTVRLSNDSTLVDRVAAVVGDSIILLSQVESELNLAIRQGQDLTADDILNSLVDAQLVLQAAALDTTLTVNQDQLAAQVEAAMQQAQQGFGTAQAFQQALAQAGMTPASYREQLRHRIRTQQLQNLYMSRRLQETPAVAVTDAEMRELFENQRGTFEQRPELLTVEQIFVKSGASDSAWAAARSEADSLRALVVGGADFAEVAREHSDDPGSAPNGGDMGWFRRGATIREFENVAFALPDGAVSQPVRTELGWHIIKKERARGQSEVKARHILVIPDVSDADIERAREDAREVARRAREGEDMEALFDEFGDPSQPFSFTESRDIIAQIPYPGYAESLESVTEGDIVGPFETRLQTGTVYFVILRVAGIREAGEFTFEDVREDIRVYLTQQKKLERILQALRNRTFIDIRM